MDWLNRITGLRSDSPGAPFAPGEWRYCGTGAITIRNAQASAGDLLLPGEDGRCPGTVTGAAQTDRHYVPDVDAIRSLRLVGARLESLDGRGWQAWREECPLLPALKDPLEETDLERQIATKLGYLEAACHRPRTHLRVDEERLIVARCKRASVRAPAALAARSEDWERRTVWGVKPRRILGLVREELYDTYENRVVVAVVDHLDTALQGRLRSIRRVVGALQQRRDYQHLLEDSTNYRRARRILSLWGGALDATAQLEHALAVLRRVMSLRRRLLALKDSLLCQQLGGSETMSLQLRMTNVLSNDLVYRRVAELWVSWEAHMRGLGVDPVETWRRDQEAAAGFERYTFLVVVRALDALGYAPKAQGREVLLDAVGEWSLEGPAGGLVLRRGEAGVSVRSRHAATPLSFVSLPAMLESGAALDDWLSRIGGGDCAIVALPPDELRAPPGARMRLRGMGGKGPGPAAFVPIAPWDLESVERMARVLRGYAWGALFGQYPPTIRVPTGLAVGGASPGWLQVNAQFAKVTRPAGPMEGGWPSLERHAEAKAAALAALVQKLHACNPRDRARLRLKDERDKAARASREAAECLENIQGACALMHALCRCPVCATVADSGAFVHGDALFKCTCLDCRSTWGQRTCGHCLKSFAFLDFPGNVPTESMLDAERRYGADVLAYPLGRNVYLCPRCGHRSDEPPPTARMPA